MIDAALVLQFMYAAGIAIFGLITVICLIVIVLLLLAVYNFIRDGC